MTRFVHVVEQLLCGGAIAKWHYGLFPSLSQSPASDNTKWG